MKIVLKIVSYLRVSTKKQGQSGLGLEAQREAVEAYARSVGGKIVAEFVEVETGKKSDRPELAKAIARARAVRGVLVVAKLDRLARNVAFTSALMESSCEFVCCDNPNANRLTVHILAAVAEDEAPRISERTVAALAAAKRRGTLLGCNRPGHIINRALGQRRGLKRAQEAASAARAEDRSSCYGHLMGEIHAMRLGGYSYRSIAAHLNENGHVTTGGAEFKAMTVQRLLSVK